MESQSENNIITFKNEDTNEDMESEKITNPNVNNDESKEKELISFCNSLKQENDNLVSSLKDVIQQNELLTTSLQKEKDQSKKLKKDISILKKSIDTLSQNLKRKQDKSYQKEDSPISFNNLLIENQKLKAELSEKGKILQLKEDSITKYLNEIKAQKSELNQNINQIRNLTAKVSSLTKVNGDQERSLKQLKDKESEFLENKKKIYLLETANNELKKEKKIYN